MKLFLKLFNPSHIMFFFNMIGEKMDIWTFLFLLIYAVGGTQSLRNVKVNIPNAVKIHDPVILQCNYDLEGEPLYTVKWYKGTMEFFRYIPKEDPSMNIFPVPGIHVDLSRSSPNEVVLLDVQLEVTGRYKCEVSTDGPNFYTELVSGWMFVVDVPDEDPIMEISKDNTGISDIINANCTTPPSYPAMNVTWYINGIKVNETSRRLVSVDPILANSRNRRVPYMTISHMGKEIDENIFQGGLIRVQCISTLFNLYRSENVRYIDDNRIQPWPSSIIGATESSADSTIRSIFTSLTPLLGIMAFL